MDLHDKPTNPLESKQDHEIARCDSGQFKKLSQDDGGCFIAMDNGVHVKIEGGYCKHETLEKDNRLLQSKLSELESKKVELEREVKVLTERNEELQLRVESFEKVREVNSEAKEAVLERSRKSLMSNETVETEEETVVQLMIEISVLQCEKQCAEREVDVWKQKCKELESRLLTLQGRSGFGSKLVTPIREKEELINNGHTSPAVNNVIQNGGICYLMTHDKPVDLKQGVEVINLGEDECSRPSKKQFFCGDDETNGEETSPSTPAGTRRRATFTVDTIDADEKHHTYTADLLPSGYQGYSVLTPFASKEAVPYSKASSMMGEDDEDMSDCNKKFAFVATPKRKRSISVVTSDTESDDDDNMPIGQLFRKNIKQLVPQPAVAESEDHSDVPTRRSQRLIKLSQYEGRKKTPKTDESENDDTDDSLENFIVSSSDVTESLDESSCEAEDFSDDSSADFNEILHRIKRTKDLGSEWELEGDMLAAFGKDPVLCMKAVCALYRQQTCDEQECHETFVLNGQGFSKFDAERGTELAEFLTDKIPNGDVTKSVEQLNEFDPDGLEKCRTLATRYSNQLFEIYQNEEDPHFFPPLL